MILNLFAYFGGGFILDVFYVLWYTGISEKNIITSTIGSFLVTIFSTGVLYYLILSPTVLPNLLAYTFGCALGTGLSVWYKNKIPLSNHK